MIGTEFNKVSNLACTVIVTGTFKMETTATLWKLWQVMTSKEVIGSK